MFNVSCQSIFLFEPHILHFKFCILHFALFSLDGAVGADYGSHRFK
jgi:hypothetical protein